MAASQIDPRSWNYEDGDGKCGPCAWIKPAKPALQSPIALNSGRNKKEGGVHCVCLAKNEHIKFIHYDTPFKGLLLNTGHSVQFTPDGPPEKMPQLEGGQLGQPFRFIQYHFHWGQKDGEGSEHTLDGHHFPAELHLVHQGMKDPSQLAVLGVFLELGREGVALKADEKALGSVKNYQQTALMEAQKLVNKLPKQRTAFIRYHGSLTTPPCSENVLWTVFTEPIAVSHEQLHALRSVHDCHGRPIARNYRELQSDNGRKVLYCTCE